jgi:uncharacterized protein (TIGR03086 family)
MSNAQFIARAAAPLAEIIRSITPDQLGCRTPCAEYDVRELANHLLFWGPCLEGAARKESVPLPAETETDVDLIGGSLVTALEAHLDRIVAAWSLPGAWQGSTQLGGPMELPAPQIGGMVVAELVVHGWDLARATGQDLTLDDDLLEYLHEEVAKTAEQGREMGVYGPEATLPATAPLMDRILGLTGRDPGWTP